MLTKSLKVVFAGTPDFAVPSLEYLLGDKRFKVSAVLTQPDRPSGRGQRVAESAVKVLAQQKGLPLYQPEKIGAAEIELIRKLQPDFLVTVAYGLILPADFLALPKYGCINVHASLLPRFRGASPVQAAILNGDKKTGISYMQTVAKLDAGPVYAREILELSGAETAGELTASLAELGGKKLPEVLVQIATGELKAEPQEEARATYAAKVKKSDGKIAWRFDTAETLTRKLRAYTPWPGIFTSYAGKILRIHALEPRKEKPTEIFAGTVFNSEGEVRVATFTDAVALQAIQLAGRKVLSIAEFVRGEPSFVGSRLW